MSTDESRPTKGMIDDVLAIPHRRAEIERHVNALGTVASAVLAHSLAAMKANQTEARAGIAMIDDEVAPAANRAALRLRLIDMWVTSTLYADAIERELERRTVRSDGGIKKVH